MPTAMEMTLTRARTIHRFFVLRSGTLRCASVSSEPEHTGSEEEHEDNDQDDVGAWRPIRNLSALPPFGTSGESDHEVNDSINEHDDGSECPRNHPS